MVIGVASLAFLCGVVGARAESCLAFAQSPGQSLVKKVALEPDEARVTFIGHATFLIESPKGVRIATDYNDYIKPPVVPDIATMNIAHDTHFTMFPDPRIRHVLHGWADTPGQPAQVDLTLDDVHVRNVPTNIRDFAGGTSEYGNSIFVFEVAGLCIAHLGHLHHTLTVQQLGQIGQMDVLLVPVDGSFTLDLDGMVEVLQALKARLIIPMHYFSRWTLERFIERVQKSFEVVRSPVPTIVVSRKTQPDHQRVLVLPGP
jgi:L-ascorbate metabolism protein UlaG (beta-lactamase superfamily)